MSRWILRVVAVAMALTASTVQAEPAMRDGFESAEVSWRDAGGDTQYRVTRHERSTAAVHTGSSAEYVEFEAANGTSVYLSHDAGRAAIIGELRPSIWMLSDHGGIQLFARIVLPRTRDPKTGEPVSTLVAGTAYASVGRWEQLRVDDVPGLLTRQARVLRAQLQADVDIREAYLDRLVINAYTGSGKSRLWVDDLEIGGFVASQGKGEGWPLASSGVEPIATPPGVDRQRQVEIADAVLRVDGRPFFPRVIRHQGEPLAFLRDLGFNTVLLGESPDLEILAQAAELGLRIVCPPPALRTTTDEPTIGPPYDPVLAWDVGWNLAERDIEPLIKTVDRVRRLDSQAGRPLVCQPDAELRTLSRHVDVLLARRLPLWTTFEMNDFGVWLREYARLARPGTPLWTVIQTDADPVHREQCQLLSGGQARGVVASGDQMRLMIYAALAAGSRGMVFESFSRLDADDSITRSRAMALRLVNLELDLIEPWAAAGRFVETVPGSLPEVSGALLQTDRARLLLPIWSGRGSQYVPGQSAANDVTFVLPGLPETHDAYEITPGGLRPLRRQRVAGGTRIMLEEFGMTSLVLITQDPTIYSSMARRISEVGSRSAQAQRDIAAERYQTAVDIDAQLAGLGHGEPQAGKHLSQANVRLQMADTQLAGGNYEAAFLEARRAVRSLSVLERTHWARAVGGLQSPAVVPLAASFTTLPAFWQWRDGLARTRWDRNLLAGGDFEDLPAMEQLGWRHYDHPQPAVKAVAELSPDGPHGGRFSLRMSVTPAGSEPLAGLVESAPVWITSPPVTLEAGQPYRVRIWANVPLPVSGSLDGLLVTDTVGGPLLAERISETSGWQEFTLWRVNPRPGPVSVLVALSGLGEAWIDDIAIEPLAIQAEVVPAYPSEQIPAGTPVPSQ